MDTFDDHKWHFLLDNNNAIRILNQAVQLDNKWAGLYYSLGYAYQEKHEYIKAIEYYKKALKVHGFKEWQPISINEIKEQLKTVENFILYTLQGDSGVAKEKDK